MNGWIYVNMPVRVIRKECGECPQLDVRTRHELLFSDEKIGACNVLSCENVDKCIRIAEWQRKGGNKDGDG